MFIKKEKLVIEVSKSSIGNLKIDFKPSPPSPITNTMTQIMYKLLNFFFYHKEVFEGAHIKLAVTIN